MKYHIADGDRQRGPYTLEELWRVDFGPETLVWRDGMPDWQRADTVADLRVVLAGRVPNHEAPESSEDPFASSRDAAGEDATESGTPARDAIHADDDDEAELEVKVPTEVRRAERVTVYPGAYPAEPPGFSPPHAPGGALPYAAGVYPHHGPLPTGAAVTSLVLGIVALLLSFFALCLWVFSGPLAIAAVVFGHIARRNANRGLAAGGGMALAGLICGYLALALTAFFMIGFLGLMAGAN